MEQGRQVKKIMAPGSGPAKGWELVIPNPKLKLMGQVREVLRVKHYAIRIEQAYCDWIRRYVRFHAMRSREDLFPGTDKVELFLSDLAVNKHVAASTQNQAFNAGRKSANIEHPTSNAEPRTQGNGAGYEYWLRSGGAAAGIFGADYPAGGAAAEHPRGEPRRQPVAAVGHVAAAEPRRGTSRGVWSPGFSRSGAVSSCISKCFEQPSRNSIRLKPGLHTLQPARVCYSALCSLVPLWNARASGGVGK